MGKSGKCRCGQEIDLGNVPVDGKITCPACGRVMTLRRKSQAPPAPERTCPWCRRPVAREATICENCGLDFQTGIRRNLSASAAPPRKTRVRFYSRPLTYIGEVPVTGARLAILGVIGAVLAAALPPLVAKVPVKILDIRPVEAFTALDGIMPYMVFLPGPEEDQKVQIGFSRIKPDRPDVPEFFSAAGGRLPKKLVFIRDNDRGNCLAIRLAISQRFLMDQKSVDRTDLQLEMMNLEFQADNRALGGQILDFEYRPPTVNADLKSAELPTKCLPPGFASQSDGSGQSFAYANVRADRGSDVQAGTGMLSGRVTMQEDLKAANDSSYVAQTMALGGSAFTANGELRYRTAAGMAVNFRYRGKFLTLTWDKDTQCRRGVQSAWETKFVFDSSKWEVLVLVPRPKAGTRNMRLKVFDRTFVIPDEYADGR